MSTEQMIDGEESFEQLFEASLQKKRKRVQPGERVTGTVLQVGVSRVLLDLGDGLDGIIDLAELATKGEAPVIKKGDTIEGFVIKIENRTAVLGKSVGKGAGSKFALEQAAKTGVPLEGTVVEVNKGGYVIETGGNRAFCPLGQMDVRRIEDPSVMIGQRLQFRVTEMRDGRDAVLSRKILMEEEAKITRQKIQSQLIVGAKLKGIITQIRDFGVFVDLGGVDGLLPASEMGYGRVKTQDVAKVGQEVNVEIIAIAPPGPKDRDNRITLSIKSFQSDPFIQACNALVSGDVLRGVVVRVQPFGAFVELAAGVDGLIHVSAFGKRVVSPSEVVKVGDSIAVRVDSIDSNNRRIALVFVAETEAATLAPSTTADAAKALGLNKIGFKTAPIVTAPEASQHFGLSESAEKKPAPLQLAVPKVGEIVETTVEKIETFGLFVGWNGNRGLIPTSELPSPKGADLRKAFPLASTLKASIIEVQNGKIRLSVNAVKIAEERAEVDAWQKTQNAAAPSGKGFGSFAALLQKAKK